MSKLSTNTEKLRAFVRTASVEEYGPLVALIPTLLDRLDALQKLWELAEPVKKALVAYVRLDERLRYGLEVIVAMDPMSQQGKVAAEALRDGAELRGDGVSTRITVKGHRT